MIDATRGQSVLLCVTWRIIRMKHEKIPLILDPEWNRKTCNVRDKCFPHLIYFRIFFEKCASVHITFFSVHICNKQQNWAAVLSPKKHTTHKILIKEKTNLAHLSTRKYIVLKPMPMMMMTMHTTTHVIAKEVCIATWSLPLRDNYTSFGIFV